MGNVIVQRRELGQEAGRLEGNELKDWEERADM